MHDVRAHSRRAYGLPTGLSADRGQTCAICIYSHTLTKIAVWDDRRDWASSIEQLLIVLVGVFMNTLGYVLYSWAFRDVEVKTKSNLLRSETMREDRNAIYHYTLKSGS